MEKNTGWEQRRYEIARDLAVSSFSRIDNYQSVQSYVACCVEIAELLVEELRKPKKQDKFSRIVEQAPEMYKALESIVKASISFPPTIQGFMNYYKEVTMIAEEAIDKCKTDYPEIEV